MNKIRSEYETVLRYGTYANLNEVLNKETISRYLYNGSYAKPGTNHFLNGYSYQKVKKLDISRKGISSLEEIEDQLRKNIRGILKSRINLSLLLTSGLDSYLIYLLLKSETNNFTSESNISLVTGRFDSPYDEYEVLKSKTSNIEIDPTCQNIRDPDEMISLLRQAVTAARQPVNGLVACAVFKAIEIASKKFSSPILGTGETIFFTSSYEFIRQVNKSDTRNYSADKTIQTLGNYLTENGQQLANKGNLNCSEQDEKIFDHSGELEEFIHNQQFFIDAPRVDYEVSSYCEYYNMKAFTPLRDPKILELFLRLPAEDQHDGRPKTPIRNLVERLEGSNNYINGPNLKMTSPQRECLKKGYHDGGFSELMEYFIDNSELVKMDIVNKQKIIEVYDSYKREFDESSEKGNFHNFSSYNIWKFFITEFWIDTVFGNRIQLKDLI